MTRKELEKFNKLLLAEKALLMQGISKKMGSSPKTGDPEGGDVCDIASSDRERELKLRLSERDREKLREIEDALERIGEGSFGECEICGAKIPMQRLKIMPFTTECVACKSKLEKQRKLFQESTDFTSSRDLGLHEINKDEEE